MTRVRHLFLTLLALVSSSVFADEPKLTRPELVVQTGHTAVLVTSVTASADGKQIASGSSDGRVRIWRLETPGVASAKPSLLRIVGSGSDPVYAVAFSSDDRYVAFGSGNALTVTEVSSGQDIFKIGVDAPAVLNIVFSSDHQWLAWDDGLTVKAWRLPADIAKLRKGPVPGEVQLFAIPNIGNVADHPRMSISSLAFSSDGGWLATGDSQGSVRLWNLRDKTRNYRLIDEPALITSITFSTDKETFATASSNYVSLWKIGSRTPFRTIRHDELVWAVSCNADTVTSISANEVGNVVRRSNWDLVKGTSKGSSTTKIKLSVLGFELSTNWPVAFSPAGNFVVFASDPKTLKTWHLSSGEESVTVDDSVAPADNSLGGSTVPVTAVASYPPKHLLAVGSGKDIELWDFLTGKRSLVKTGYQKSIQSLTFSQDGSFLTSTTDDRRVTVWAVASGQQIKDVRAPYGQFVVAGTTHIGTGTSDGVVTLFDVRGGSQTVLKVGRLLEVSRTSANRDATLLASGSQLFGNVQVWLPNNEHALQTVKTRFYANSDLQFSPDNKYLAWGTHDGHVAVLDIGSGELLELCCHGRWTTSVVFSQDTRLLFSGGSDHEIRAWDLAKPWDSKRKEIAVFSGHTGDVRSLALAGDGHILVSGSDDGTTRFWDVLQRRELADFVSMSARQLWLVVTPEGLFDGTATAIESVSWRLPGTNDVFPLDAFYNDYFHPDLAPEIIGGAHPSPCMDIAALLRVPGVQTMRQQRMHTELQDGHAVLCLPDRPNLDLFEGLDARVRGLPIAMKSSDFHRGPSSTCRYALDLRGVPSDVELNTRLSPVALSCRTLPKETVGGECVVGQRIGSSGSVFHVQTIAISKYPPNSDYGTLTNATQDARTLEGLFKKRSPHTEDAYGAIRVWDGLFDSQARLIDIQQRFAAMLREVKEDDIVLLMLTGHGTVPPGQEMFYFIPVDGKADSEADTALSTAMIGDFVRQLRARRVLILINACQSGGAMDSLAKIIAVKESAEDRISSLSHKNSQPPLAGTHVIAASIPFQVANAPNGEDPFAGALIELVKRADGDTSEDVCARDMTLYVYDEVVKRLKAKGENQTPLKLSAGSNFLILAK